MPSVTLTKIMKEADGRIRVKFSVRAGDTFGKREKEFASIQHLRSFVSGQLDVEVLEALFLRLALDRQPALGNPTVFEGRVLTVDFSSPTNWGTVS